MLYFIVDNVILKQIDKSSQICGILRQNHNHNHTHIYIAPLRGGFRGAGGGIKARIHRSRSNSRILQIMRRPCLVGWEINVPFQHKNRLYRGQGLGWRLEIQFWQVKDGLRYGNLPTLLPFCSATTQNGKN